MKYFLFQLKNALGDFKRNKTRTFLASLGILIGVLSVVMLIALGIGLKNYIKNQFENLGANLILVFPGSGFSQGAANFGPGLAGGAKFDEKDIRDLQRVSELDYVVPSFIKSVAVEAGKEKETGYVIGTTDEYFRLLNAEVIVGKLFEKADIQARSKKVVIGYNLSEKLFGTAEDGLGKTVRVGDQRFTIIGVVKKTGDREQDSSLVVPYKTIFGTLDTDKTFFSIYLGVKNENDIQIAKDKAKETLLKRYKEDDFSVDEQSEILNSVNQIFGVLNGILIAIGSISLIVGGIGIMNIMYANVTERTKEIGIRRAIGATKRDILTQFVAESVLLSLFGGLLGLIISTVLVLIIRPFFPVALNLIAVTVAIGISTAIGVFFGVFPARRASNLTPIKAIRYE